MTLTKGQQVQYTFYGATETAKIDRVANGIVWLDNGRWMHAESVTPVPADYSQATKEQAQTGHLLVSAAKAAGRSKQAKARKLGESVSYQVYIIGVAWQGFEGTYSYTFDHEPTSDEIKRKAGDFQAILDYETVEMRTIHYSDGERRIVKTVRPWAGGEESIQKYCDANEC